MSHATDCLSKSLERAWDWLTETHRSQQTGKWTEHEFWVTENGRVLRADDLSKYPATRKWLVGTFTREIGLDDFRKAVFEAFDKRGKAA